jgi:hypothetical protein
MRTRAFYRHILAALIILLFIGEGFLFGQYYIYMKGEWLRVYGQRREGPYNTLAEAQRAQKAMARGGVSWGQVLANTEIKGSPAGGGANRSSSSVQGDSPQMQIARPLIGALLDFIFAPDTSAQDAIAKQRAREAEEAARLREEEADRQRWEEENTAALARWTDHLNKEARNKENEKAKTLEDAERLLEKLRPIGGGLKPQAALTDVPPDGAVDLRNTTGIVRPLASPEEQRRADQWILENTPNMTSIPENGIEEGRPTTSKFEDSKEYKIIEAYFDQIGKHPLGKLPAYLGKYMLNVVNESFVSIEAATTAFAEGKPLPENPLQSVMYNSAEKTLVGDLTERGENKVKETGVGFVEAEHGYPGKADAELVTNLAGDTKTVLEIRAARWYGRK